MEIEPVTTARVAALIHELDANEFSTRASATKALIEIGPVAIAMLRAELKNGPSTEMRRRIENVLERIDAIDWLKVP